MINIRLKEAAESQGRNLNYIVLHSGVSTGTVRSYWHNKARRVDLDVVERICDLLGIEIGDLLKKEPGTDAD